VQLLDQAVTPGAPLAPATVAAKVCLDQLVQTPFGMALFLTTMKLLEGRPGEVQQELRSKVCCLAETGAAWCVALMLGALRPDPRAPWLPACHCVRR
jgi:hypothetical protein